MLEMNRLYNMDCMQGMKEFPDGFFDIAIVDPPYGIGVDGQKKRVCSNPKHNRKEHIRKSWDKAIPPPEYFRELERVSKNQVIWGGVITLCHISNRDIKAGLYGTRGNTGFLCLIAN